jgi:hypothetical protein
MPGRGKRGGARVIYYYLDHSYPVTLISGYAKSERSDLTAAELAAMKAVIAQIKLQARRP